MGDQQSPVWSTLITQTGINEFPSSPPLPAAQPLARMLICRAGHNVLIDRRSSTFISQKSPHFVLLLPAAQITHPRVLSIPSLTVPGTLSPEGTNTPSPQLGHSHSQSPKLGTCNPFLSNSNRKCWKDKRFNLEFAYSNLSLQ